MSAQNTIGRLLVLLFATYVISGCSSTAHTQAPVGATQAGKPDSKQQWLCEANLDRQWQCLDLSQSQTSASPQSTAAANTVVVKETVNASIAIDHSAFIPTPAADNTIARITDKHSYNNSPPDNRLNNYPNNYLVVQLIAARSQQTVDNFIQQHPRLAMQQLTTLRDGQRWQHLILGPYPSYRAAQQAIAEIAPPLSTTPWIRPIAPLKANLVSSTP